MATATSPEIGTNGTAVIDGKQVRVQVCGIDERYGIRVTNRHWGGDVGEWVQARDLAID